MALLPLILGSSPVLVVVGDEGNPNTTSQVELSCLQSHEGRKHRRCLWGADAMKDCAEDSDCAEAEPGQCGHPNNTCHHAEYCRGAVGSAITSSGYRIEEGSFLSYFNRDLAARGDREGRCYDGDRRFQSCVLGLGGPPQYQCGDGARIGCREKPVGTPRQGVCAEGSSTHEWGICGSDEDCGTGRCNLTPCEDVNGDGFCGSSEMVAENEALCRSLGGVVSRYPTHPDTVSRVWPEQGDGRLDYGMAYARTFVRVEEWAEFLGCVARDEDSPLWNDAVLAHPVSNASAVTAPASHYPIEGTTGVMSRSSGPPFVYSVTPQGRNMPVIASPMQMRVYVNWLSMGRPCLGTFASVVDGPYRCYGSQLGRCATERRPGWSWFIPNHRESIKAYHFNPNLLGPGRGQYAWFGQLARETGGSTPGHSGPRALDHSQRPTIGDLSRGAQINSCGASRDCREKTCDGQPALCVGETGRGVYPVDAGEQFTSHYGVVQPGGNVFTWLEGSTGRGLEPDWCRTMLHGGGWYPSVKDAMATTLTSASCMDTATHIGHRVATYRATVWKPLTADPGYLPPSQSPCDHTWTLAEGDIARWAKGGSPARHRDDRDGSGDVILCLSTADGWDARGLGQQNFDGLDCSAAPCLMRPEPFDFSDPSGLHAAQHPRNRRVLYGAAVITLDEARIFDSTDFMMFGISFRPNTNPTNALVEMQNSTRSGLLLSELSCEECPGTDTGGEVAIQLLGPTDSLRFELLHVHDPPGRPDYRRQTTWAGRDTAAFAFAHYPGIANDGRDYLDTRIGMVEVSDYRGVSFASATSGRAENCENPASPHYQGAVARQTLISNGDWYTTPAYVYSCQMGAGFPPLGEDDACDGTEAVLLDNKHNPLGPSGGFGEANVVIGNRAHGSRPSWQDWAAERAFPLPSASNSWVADLPGCDEALAKSGDAVQYVLDGRDRYDCSVGGGGQDLGDQHICVCREDWSRPGTWDWFARRWHGGSGQNGARAITDGSDCGGGLKILDNVIFDVGQGVAVSGGPHLISGNLFAGIRELGGMRTGSGGKVAAGVWANQLPYPFVAANNIFADVQNPVWIARPEVPVVRNLVLNPVAGADWDRMDPIDARLRGDNRVHAGWDSDPDDLAMNLFPCGNDGDGCGHPSEYIYDGRDDEAIAEAGMEEVCYEARWITGLGAGTPVWHCFPYAHAPQEPSRPSRRGDGSRLRLLEP